MAAAQSQIFFYVRSLDLAWRHDLDDLGAEIFSKGAKRIYGKGTHAKNGGAAYRRFRTIREQPDR